MENMGTADWAAMTTFLQTAGVLSLSYTLFVLGFVAGLKRRSGVWQWLFGVATALLVVLVFGMRSVT